MTGAGTGIETMSPEVGSRGDAMMALVRELYPVLRSITGAGLRTTLDAIGRRLPGLSRRSVPSGSKVLDWTVPKEWNVRQAYLLGPDGRRVVDVADHTLHLVQYSVPMNAEMSLEALRPHLHSLPEQPDRIPYRTSYYREDWGFCLRHDRLERLPQGTYRVHIDTTLAEGSLDFGELVLPGDRDEEVLLSAHICHPSLANDNLSAVAVLVELGLALAARPRRRYRYRLLFAPGTIGAIAFLATTPEAVARMRHGLVLAGVGDAGALHYKRTRDGAAIDRVMAQVLRQRGPHQLLPFSPDGYDERQYNSPGFRLPVGRLGRTPYGTYPEYHSSGDDLAFIHADALQATLETLLDAVEVLEHDGTYRNTAGFGEPQLGRRGVYRDLGGIPGAKRLERAIFWVLNLSGGDHSLLDIAERSGLPFGTVHAAQELLSSYRLLERQDPA